MCGDPHSPSPYPHPRGERERIVSFCVPHSALGGGNKDLTPRRPMLYCLVEWTGPGGPGGAACRHAAREGLQRASLGFRVPRAPASRASSYRREGPGRREGKAAIAPGLERLRGFFLNAECGPRPCSGRPEQGRRAECGSPKQATRRRQGYGGQAGNGQQGKTFSRRMLLTPADESRFFGTNLQDLFREDGLSRRSPQDGAGKASANQERKP